MAVLDTEKYITGVLAGNRRILSKTITLIESAHPDHTALAMDVIHSLLPHSGNAIRLGITGVPGVGKSTFIDHFGMHLIEQGYKVAVLAVDPSSSRSGGSILGDKTRMERLSVDRGAYIRPSPSSGTLGGVARKTRETMLICEAAGFDVVIVETVGVGQSEIQVANMVDFFLVLMLAGAGDVLQGIKKGVLELADAIAINKADGDNIQKAEKARLEYEKALHFLMPFSPNWLPPALTCSALTGDGLEKIWQTVLGYRKKLRKTGELADKRKKQSIDWMWNLVDDGLKERFYASRKIRDMLRRISIAVENGTKVPTTAALELLNEFDSCYTQKQT